MAKIFKAAKGSSLIGKTIKVGIDRLDINGIGVGKYQKHSVFIANTLIGEQVTAKVTEQNSKHVKAKALKVNQVSLDRIKPICEHYYQCGGCDIQHLSHQAQLHFKQQKVTELFARQELEELSWQPPVFGDVTQYRRKARIGVQYNKLGQHLLGFRMRESNTLTVIKSCPVLTANLTDVFEQLNGVLSQAKQPHAVGHIEVIDADKVTLIIRQLKPMTADVLGLWHSLSQKQSWRILIDDGNQIVNLESDQEMLSYFLQVSNISSELTINFTPDSFIQVNQKVNQLMVDQAIDWLALSANDVVLDLFCGLGNFSLPIAKQVSHVTGVEGVADMVTLATKNAQSNSISNCDFYQLDLNSNWQQQQWSKQPFNKVLLDPARAGAYEACKQLLAFKATHILYVSCDPSTLAKDAKLIVEHGYRLKKIALIDMFTHTKHVETMVLFERTIG